MRRVLAGPLLAVAAVLLCVTAPAAGAALKARGSIGQAYVVGAKKGQRLVLRGPGGGVAATGRADRFGSKIFRGLKPGGGYRVGPSRPFRVLRAGGSPSRSFYRRKKLK